jgi:hypothetical protein
MAVTLQVREKIEMSGRDARWEFPKQLLFARTNYMAEICNDLIEMVEIVDDFFKFLGPELKAVTGGWGWSTGHSGRCNMMDAALLIQLGHIELLKVGLCQIR